MPKLTGVFLQFKNLDQITISNVAARLKSSGDLTALENFFGNRILYPQTIPQSAYDMQVDLAILGEALRSTPGFVLGKNDSLLLTDEILKRFQPLPSLLRIISQNVKIKPVTPIYLKREPLTNLVGTIITPNIHKKPNDKVNIFVNGQNLLLKMGSFTILPFNDRHIKLKIEDEPVQTVAGGELGLVFDLTKI